MKKLILFIAIGILLSCQPAGKRSPYMKYIESYNNQGFESIADLLADTIIIQDIGAYEARYSREEFKVFYQWDSAFSPVYEILEYHRTGSTEEVTQSSSSVRFEFLGNDPLVFRRRIHLQKGKIHRIETHKYLEADWTIWASKRDSLVAWIDEFHPELSGFIYDMTPDGARNYREAIERYRNSKLNQ
jgi:hypothetical protein